MCHPETDSRSSVRTGTGFAQANCWGCWGLEGQLEDPFVHVSLSLGVRQLKRERIQGQDGPYCAYCTHTLYTYILVVPANRLSF